MKRLLALLMALMLIMLAIPMAAGAEAAEKKIIFQMSGEPECMDPTMNDYSSGSYALQSLFRGCDVRVARDILRLPGGSRGLLALRWGDFGGFRRDDLPNHPLRLADIQ